MLALLCTVSVPFTLPELLGANMACNHVLCPGARVVGTVPPQLKPAPVVYTTEIVTLEFPVLVKFTVWRPTVPSATLPKLKLVALTDSRLAEEAGRAVG